MAESMGGVVVGGGGGGGKVEVTEIRRTEQCVYCIAECLLCTAFFVRLGTSGEKIETEEYERATLL